MSCCSIPDCKVIMFTATCSFTNSNHRYLNFMYLICKSFIINNLEANFKSSLINIILCRCGIWCWNIGICNGTSICTDKTWHHGDDLVTLDNIPNQMTENREEKFLEKLGTKLLYTLLEVAKYWN